ncbi:MAG: hypothetical protein M1836_007273 [Candelina mexicana]|nr:MAG: hypothetical protein M1836_007273 [Candelina mexicana]
MGFNITIDHATTAHGSEHSSFTDEEDSSGTGVHLSPTSAGDSQEYPDSFEEPEGWDVLYPHEIGPSDSASRPRTSNRNRPSDEAHRPAPRRRSSSRRHTGQERAPHTSRPRPHRQPPPRAPESVDPADEYPGYARGQPPPHARTHPHWPPHIAGALPPGYPPSFVSAPGYNQYTAGSPYPPGNQMVPYGGQGAYGFGQPFSPAAAPGAQGYFAQGHHGNPHVGNPMPPHPVAPFSGQEMMPYAPPPGYYGYNPQAYAMQQQQGPGSPMYYPQYPAVQPAPSVASTPPPDTSKEDEKFARIEKLIMDQKIEQEAKEAAAKKAAEEKAVKDAADKQAADAAAAAAAAAAKEAADKKVADEAATAALKAKFEADIKAAEAAATAKAVTEAREAAEKKAADAAAAKAAEEKMKAEIKAAETAAAAKALENQRKAAEKKAADEAAAKAAADKIAADIKAAEEAAVAKAKIEAEKAAAEEKEKAKAAAEKAAASAPAPKKPIRFKDAVGRKFSFPFHLCATWQGMDDLIKQAFVHVEVIGPHVIEGHYDLIGPNGEIILPQVWETMIEPDWLITMQMWPMPEPKPPKPVLPPPPPLAGPPGGVVLIEPPKGVKKKGGGPGPPGPGLVPGPPPPPPVIPPGPGLAAAGPPPPPPGPSAPPGLVLGGGPPGAGKKPNKPTKVSPLLAWTAGRTAGKNSGKVLEKPSQGDACRVM